MEEFDIHKRTSDAINSMFLKSINKYNKLFNFDKNIKPKKNYFERIVFMIIGAIITVLIGLLKDILIH